MKKSKLLSLSIIITIGVVSFILEPVFNYNYIYRLICSAILGIPMGSLWAIWYDCKKEERFEMSYPKPSLPPRRMINVHDRVEHEAILKDPEKCRSLGIDPVYETVVYLHRWGGWLDEQSKKSEG